MYVYVHMDILRYKMENTKYAQVALAKCTHT